MRELLKHLAHQLNRFSPGDPYERCGFLWSRRYGNPISLREVPNVHPEPASNFRIDSSTVLSTLEHWTLRKGVLGPVGVFHTHPGYGKWEDALPSASDFAGAVKHTELLYYVYHPYTRRLTVYSDRGIRDSFHLKARWVSRKGI